MSSASLERWQTVRATTLDEIEAAHSSVGGIERGRRYATQQINHAYVVLLSGQFQGFCRDLHTECVVALIQPIPLPLQTLVKDNLVRDRLVRDRRLDKGNPNPGNLGSDFGRFGFSFWQVLYAQSARNSLYRPLLEELNDWRNAVAHQDFSSVGGPSAAIQLRKVRQYRKVCNGLAKAFDSVLYQQLKNKTGSAPW